MNTQRILRLLTVAAAALSGSLFGAAQNGTLTNQDVVTLAGAGFSEGFILDAIAGSQTQFDTSATALAELAKHSINERIIRVMMEQNAPAVMTVSAVSAESPEEMPVAMPALHGTRSPKGEKAAKPARVPPGAVVAMQSGTPFYEWKSVFWGLWRKRVEVVPPQAQQPAMAQHLGPMFARPQQAPPAHAKTAQAAAYYLVAPR